MHINKNVITNLILTFPSLFFVLGTQISFASAIFISYECDGS